MEQKKLTTAQWELYNYVKYVTVIENRATNVKEICERFSGEYAFQDKEGNHSNCPRLYKDINEINEYVEKSIITDHNKIRLATREEQEREWERYIARGLKWLKKGYLLKRKASRDGSGKLIGCNGDPIDEKSQARAFVQAFVDDLIQDFPVQEDEKLCS